MSKNCENPQRPFTESAQDQMHEAQTSNPLLSGKLLLSVRETSDLLGVSKRTIFLLLSTGEIKRQKVRGRTMIHRDDILNFARG